LLADELTGLNNRRGFYLLAEAALRAARRDRGDFLLALLDVDGLKHVNNEHGHDVGDLLISDVALVMGAALRESDILARMGGDEFCVLVINPKDGPAMLRLRLVEAFRHFNATDTRPYQLSASIGIVAGVADDSTTVDELLARADELMYREKRSRPGARLTD
jgi:diguanylate cyclase (GGDEF)-like protein